VQAVTEHGGGALSRVTSRATIGVDVTSPPPQLHGIRVDPSVRSIVVVGNGIAGLTAAERARHLHRDCEVHLVGRDPWHTYNGTALAKLVTGHGELIDIGLLPAGWFDERGITEHVGAPATALDLSTQEVTLEGGERLRYDRLILATGAAPLVPRIAGLALRGVHALKTPEQALAVVRASTPARHGIAVVAGAGAPGIATATALRSSGLEVHLVDGDAWPAGTLVDERAGGLLRARLGSLGIHLHTGLTAARVNGERQVSSVSLSDGLQISCGLLFICSGTRPDTALARAAGLQVRTGIVVNDAMGTSHPYVFAVGAAAEHSAVRSGSWQAAMDQAEVAAEQAVALWPPGARRYRPGPEVTQLGLPDLDVVSIGRIRPEPTDNTILVVDDPAGRRYVKTIVAGDGSVAGGVVVDDPTAGAALVSLAIDQIDVRPGLEKLRHPNLTVLQPAAAHPHPRRRQVARVAVAVAGCAAIAASALAVLPSEGLPDLGVSSRPSDATASAPAAPMATPTPPSLDPGAAQVLEHPRIAWSPTARRTLTAVGADPRLLTLLAALAADHRITVVELPKTSSPAAGQPRSALLISAVDGRPVSNGPAATQLAEWFRAQLPPYRPTTVLPIGGETPVLLISLDKPSA